MEGQKRSRKAGRSLQRAGKKLTACLLSAAMVLTNVGADVGTAFASDSASEVTFEVAGSELVRAVEEAVAQGNEVQPEDINFTDGKIDRFEKLLFGDGKLYEAYPEFDEDGGVDAYVRVFVNLPEDADDMYMVTGDEELIFLYVNNSDEKISCGTNITRMVDGEEKVKRTSRVTLRSYESAYGDDEEEEEVITQPIASPSDAWEAGQTEGQAPAAEEAAGSEDGTQAPSEETAGEEEEKTEAPEAEVSDHETPVVQAKEDGAQPAVEESVVRILTEEEAEDKAQESESPEESAQAQESEPIEESAQAQESESIEESAQAQESEPIEESAQAQESEPIEESTQAQESQSPEESTSEETGSVVEVGTPEETEETKETLPAEELVPAQPQNPEQGTEASQNPPAEPETATPSQPEPAEPQQPEDDGHENNAPEAGRNDLVGIDGCSTAKAVTTTLNKVKAFEDIEGFAVSYELNIEGAARIVEGPRGVEEGEELAFGVKNQLGYAIQSVEVNGQETEAVQIQDNEDGSQTAWYSVPEVSEEQEVYVTLEETAIHPAVTLEPIVMDDGMVITISAEEGVLPDGVTATAVRVSQDVEQAVMDSENAGSEDRTVSSVMAYDINLWLNGQLLDSEIWGGSKRVNVTFSGAPMEAQSGEADAFEVVYVKTAQDSDKAAKELLAAQETEVAPQDIVDVETVSQTAAAEEISFMAEHFSVYAVVGVKLAAEEAYDGYFYIRKPGTENNGYIDYTDAWYYVGKVPGAIRGLERPSGEGHKEYGVEDHIKQYPESYPEIEYGNETYEYAKDGNEDGTYTIEWRYIVDSEGANDGDIAITHDKVYHVDGYATLNDSQKFTVEFLLQKPNERYDPVMSYMAEENTAMNQLPQPEIVKENPDPELGQVAETIIVDGQTYQFDGWYLDQQFKEKADFSTETPITQNTQFYGKYNLVQTEADYIVEYYYQVEGKYALEADFKSEPKTGTIGQTVSVTNEDKIPKKTGYVFDESYKENVLEDVLTEDGLTLKVYFKQQFTVTYDPGEHGTFGQKSYNGLDYNQKTPAAPDITGEPGYTFRGWKPKQSDRVTADQTYIAQWKADEAIIQFNTNGGTDVDKWIGTTGAPTQKTSMPKTTREGYTFAGWYLSEDFSGDAVTDPPEKYPAGTTTYYANWTPNQVTIRFEENGGSDVADISGNVGETVSGELPETKKDGYWFDGWYEDVSLTGEKVKALPSEFPVEDITYYAKWTPIPAKIVFEENGGSEVPDKKGVTGSIVEGRLPDENDITRDGYKFVGWYSDRELTNLVKVLPDVFPAGITTYYAKWEAQESQIIFNVNGGTPVDTMKGKTDEIIENRKMPATTRPGYDFGGWYAHGERVMKLPEKYPAGTICYYACWIPRTDTPYTVAFYYQSPATGEYGLADGMPNDTDERRGTTGKTVAITAADKNPDPTISLGNMYVLDEQRTIEQAECAGDGSTVLEVYFKLQYKVIYKADGYGTINGEASQLVNWQGATEEVTAKADLGYHFVKWDDENFEPSRRDEDVKANAVYTAIFKANTNTPYTVEFYYQSPATGEYGRIPNDIEERYGTTGETVAITAADKNPDPTISQRNMYVLDEQQTIEQAECAGDGNTVLKVYFKLQYQVSYKTDGHGTINGEASQLVDWQGNTEEVTAEADPGYHFVKWDDGIAKPSRWDEGVKANAVYTAIFEANTDTPYTVEFYYQSPATGVYGFDNGKPNATEERHGTTGKTVAITAEDKNPDLDISQGNMYMYVLDEQQTIEQAECAGDGSTVLKVYFKLQYQVSYKTDGHGTINGEAFQLVDWQGDTQKVTAKADPGYHFVGWNDGIAEPSRRDEGVKANAVYTAIFEGNSDVSYQVKYLEQGTEKELAAPKTVKDRIFGQTYEETAVSVPGYTVVGGETQSFTLDRYEKEIIFYYTENENVHLYYQSADPEMGSVSPESEELAPATGIASGSNAMAKDGYRFTHWTDAHLATVSDAQAFVPEKAEGEAWTDGTTYTAHFEARNDLHYEVHYFYENETGAVTENEAQRVISEQGVFGTSIPYTAESPVTFNGENYVLDQVEGEGKTVTTDAAANIVNVYYAVDKIGPADPTDPDNTNKPDQVPDKYQVVFTYVSADDTQGTVEGTVSEVHTRKKNADGSYDMTETFTPNADVTVNGIGRYYFDHWQAEDGSIYNNVAEIHTHSFDGDMTFTAYFEYRGSSSGGGGGGGGTDNGGNGRYQPEDGGPGAETVTIGPDDVPLASLPDGMGTGTVPIDPNAVPLAPLPKTGQSTSKISLAAMLSGIVLALTALSRKRREEKDA